MKPSSILLLILCCLAFSCQAGNGIIHLTDSNYAVIAYSPSDSFPFENGKATTLAKQDIKPIETLLNLCLDQHNMPKNFIFQLVPIINKKGQKEVWINALCTNPMSTFSTDGGDWKKEIIQVMDGGACFFQLKMNLKTKKYYHFRINGEA